MNLFNLLMTFEVYIVKFSSFYIITLELNDLWHDES